ncbi:MAG TPA: hypothetical protein VKA68_00080 [bacterium]|nr:hypothetical protein [bacterium]
MESEFWGVEEIMENLDALTEEARRMLETRNVPVYELFTPEFIQEYTEFADLQSLFDSNEFAIHSPEDFGTIPDDQWDAYITGNTDFSDWAEMLQTAVEEWVERQLGGR